MTEPNADEKEFQTPVTPEENQQTQLDRMEAQLKAINNKLSFIAFLIVLYLVVSYFSAILR